MIQARWDRLVEAVQGVASPSACFNLFAWVAYGWLLGKRFELIREAEVTWALPVGFTGTNFYTPVRVFLSAVTAFLQQIGLGSYLTISSVPSQQELMDRLDPDSLESNQAMWHEWVGESRNLDPNFQAPQAVVLFHQVQQVMRGELVRNIQGPALQSILGRSRQLMEDIAHQHPKS